MPGIFGVANSHDANKNLNKMADSMKLYEHFIQDGLFHDNYVGASRVHTGQVGEKSSPLEHLGFKVWVEGEAYNISEVSRELSLQANGLAELLLAAERSHQLDRCLKLLDGYFCAALYDREQRKVKLLSDRYGMRLLYWYHKGGLFAWGSEVKAILALEAVDKKLDGTSYDCFMDLGYLLGEHTWFEHVKLIKPATVIEYQIGIDTVNQYHYWKWSDIKPSSLSFEEAVDKVGQTFIAAIGRRFNPQERIGVSLSGGLDSRAILAAVDYLYPDYTGYAFTFGIPQCDDITIAEQVVAQTKSWQHEKFYFSADNWFEPRKEKIWHTDGMQDMLHMHGSEFLPTAHQKICINLNGYAGDVVLGGGFLTRVQWDKRISEADCKSFYKQYTNLADINSDFYDIDCAEPHLLMNRVRRFTIYGSINSLSWLEQRKPFFDNKLMELVYSLPDAYRANNRLYSAILKKYFPKYFNDIPWQQTGKPVTEVTRASLPMRVFRKGMGVIGRVTGIKSKQAYTDYPSWIRNKEVSAKLSELLASDTAEYKRIVEADLANRWLYPHLNNKVKDNSNEILRSATIELYLRRAFRERNESLGS